MRFLLVLNLINGTNDTVRVMNELQCIGRDILKDIFELEPNVLQRILFLGKKILNLILINKRRSRLNKLRKTLI